MTDLTHLIGRLRAHEKQMEFLFDLIVGLRDKQTDPELRESLNSMKYVLAGRPACVSEAADALQSLTARVAGMEEALRPFAQWDDLTLHQLAGPGTDDFPDDHPVLSRRSAGYLVTVGDFKRARAALNPVEGE